MSRLMAISFKIMFFELQKELQIWKLLDSFRHRPFFVQVVRTHTISYEYNVGF
jgi:hypothetical protein